MPQISDVGKLALLALIIVGLFGGLIFGSLAFDDVKPYFTLIVGFLIGGAEVAVRKQAPSSVVVPNVDEHEIATTHGTQPARITVETNAENVNGD